MRSVVVVIAPPCVDDEFGVADAIEEMFVEAFISEAAGRPQRVGCSCMWGAPLPTRSPHL